MLAIFKTQPSCSVTWKLPPCEPHRKGKVWNIIFCEEPGLPTLPLPRQRGRSQDVQGSKGLQLLGSPRSGCFISTTFSQVTQTLTFTWQVISHSLSIGLLSWALLFSLKAIILFLFTPLDVSTYFSLEKTANGALMNGKHICLPRR